MIFDFDSMPTQRKAHVQGGEKELISQAFEQPGKIRIMRGTLEPGATIGAHTHVTNLEVYYILSGRGTVLYDGVPEPIRAGQAHYCPQGHSHSLLNDSGEPLCFLAVIPELGAGE